LYCNHRWQFSELETSRFVYSAGYRFGRERQLICKYAIWICKWRP